MTTATTLHAPARAAVVGASGGIGAALVHRLAERDGIGHIHALARSAVSFDLPQVTCHTLDFASERTISEAAEEIGSLGQLDLVIIATGILHRDRLIQPEKSMADIDATQMADVFAINAIGPTLVAKHFLPLLRADRRTVFASISARVGSIEDNRLGGWISYRASKAALNMVVRTLAIEHARKRPQSLVVSLHPGTVATALSKPFKARVAEDKLFSTERAATQLLDVIDGLPEDATGGFFAWDGSRIPF